MYFLAIIGGGPAGYTAAELAAKAGKQVVLFEQKAIGGTCLNEGCIPTKTLLYSAKQYSNAVHADKYGVQAAEVRFDYGRMMQRKAKVVRKLAAGIKQRLKAVEYVEGTAQMVGKGASYTDESPVWQICCNDTLYEASNVLICTGSSTFMPPIKGLKESEAVWDSTAALASKELPESVIIIGGGVIGMEFATLYSALDIPVTVVEAQAHILPSLDEDISTYLHTTYTKRGIRILTGTAVDAIDGHTVVLHNEERLEADRIIVCVGRRSNLHGLEALGELEYQRGAIVVDDFMRTNLPGIYAAGDVTGKQMLAHVATRQAEVAVGRMLKQIPLQRIAYNAIPSVVYTNPEIASVGISAHELEGCEAHTIPLTYSGRFVAENETETGMCKVVVNTKSQAIMGVHLIGNPASECIAAASFAVRMGYTLSEFKQVVFPHPTVGEVIREAVESI